MFSLIDSIGWQEMLLLLVIGLLLYGRNLPEAGRNLGKLMAQLKRGFDEFKQQLARDADLREMKDTARDLRRVGEIPRAVANPLQAAKTMAREALTAPAPAEPQQPPADQPPESEPKP